MADKNKALALVRRNNSSLTFESDGEITNVIRGAMANRISEEIEDLRNVNTGGLGRIASWWRRGKIDAQTKYEVSLNEKEKAIYERVRQSVAGQYGITVEMLDEFTRLKFQAQLRNLEAEQKHSRDKEMLTHVTSQGIRKAKSDAKIQRANYAHTSRVDRKNTTHNTNETIRLEKARSKQKRREHRSQVIWDAASHVAKVVVDVAAEAVRADLEQKKAQNQVRLAASYQNIVRHQRDDEIAEKIMLLKRQRDHSNDPTERQVLKARIDTLKGELGVGNRHRKTNNGQNHRGANKNRDARGGRS